MFRSFPLWEFTSQETKSCVASSALALWVPLLSLRQIVLSLFNKDGHRHNEFKKSGHIRITGIFETGKKSQFLLGSAFLSWDWLVSWHSVLFYISFYVAAWIGVKRRSRCMWALPISQFYFSGLTFHPRGDSQNSLSFPHWVTPPLPCSFALEFPSSWELSTKLFSIFRKHSILLKDPQKHPNTPS